MQSFSLSRFISIGFVLRKPGLFDVIVSEKIELFGISRNELQLNELCTISAELLILTFKDIFS